MTEETNDLRSLMERLEKVERQHRRMRFLVGGILLLAVAALLVGQARPRTPRTVEAERFLLRGTDGKVRAELHTLSPTGMPCLVLRDAQEVDRGEFFLIADGSPVMVLSDKDGWIRSRLSNWGLDLLEPDAKPRVTLGFGTLTPLSPGGTLSQTRTPHLEFYSSERKVMWSAP